MIHGPRGAYKYSPLSPKHSRRERLSHVPIEYHKVIEVIHGYHYEISTCTSYKASQTRSGVLATSIDNVA